MIISTNILIKYLKKNKIKKIFVVGNHNLKKELKKNKFDLKSNNPSYVVVGYDDQLNYNKLQKACEYINKGVGLLGSGLNQSTLDQLVLEHDYQVYLLENLRFHEEEMKYKSMDLTNNESYQVIQKLGNVYVNDAFGCMHRDHLSITGIQIPEKAYGFLVEKELHALHNITQNKSLKKILAIIGGGKMDDKLELLKNLSKKVDHIFICGGNVNSILKNNRPLSRIPVY